MITVAHDLMWQRIVDEIPSRHITPALSRNIFGYRAALAEFVSGCEGGYIRYLEVGCRLGHSLAVVMMAAKKCSVDATVVDLWIKGYGDEPNPGPAAVIKHLHALGVNTGRVKIWDGNSHDILPTLKGSFDLILVDGDHTEEGAEADIRDCASRLSLNGLMIFDDAVEPLLSVWRRVSHELGLTSTEHLDRYPWCEGRWAS